MTQIIPNGGTRDSQDLYVGNPGEITIDYSNWEIRLHDGATPGGKKIANLDSLTNMFQKKSAELNGLIGFGPNAKGILVRTAAATYALRQFTSVNESLTIENPRGYEGDLDFRLSDVVPGDHVWQGQQLFNDVIQADAGINGDLAGNVVGDVTGDLTGDSTGKHIGDVDVRGKTLQLDDDQIAQSAVSGLSEALTGLVTPLGTIVMWGLTIEDIPDGWALCDGSNGTPDLTDRFILGTATTADIGETGGTLTHTHVGTIASDGIHTHTGTGGDATLDVTQIPEHEHYNGVVDSAANVLFCYGGVAAAPSMASSIDDNSADGVYQGRTSKTGGSAGVCQPHSHSVTIEDSGEHTHDVTIDPIEDLLPPYIRLAYIMKVS